MIDDDMLTFALALRAKGVPVPDIAAKLTITCRRHPWTRHFPWVDGPAWFTRTLAAFLG